MSPIAVLSAAYAGENAAGRGEINPELAGRSIALS